MTLRFLAAPREKRALRWDANSVRRPIKNSGAVRLRICNLVLAYMSAIDIRQTILR